MSAKARVAIAFLVLSVTFQIWAFTTVPEAKIYLGSPPMPDMRLGGYHPEDLRELLLQIGEQGRRTYLVAQRKIDLVIPALGTGMFVMGIWALADGVAWRGRRMSSRRALALASIGLLVALFDYGENMLVAAAMRAGPQALDPASVELASLCTRLKFTSVGAALALIAALAVMRWRQRH